MKGKPTFQNFPIYVPIIISTFRPCFTKYVCIWQNKNVLHVHCEELRAASMLKYIWPTWLVTVKLLSSQVPWMYTVSFILFISCYTRGRYLFHTAQIQAFCLKLIGASAFLDLKTHFYKTHHNEFCFHLHPLFSDKSLQLCFW